MEAEVQVKLSQVMFQLTVFAVLYCYRDSNALDRKSLTYQAPTQWMENNRLTSAQKAYSV